LPRPFLVLATENPSELEGTFPLPEAQLDRFMLRIEIGYPDAEDEDQMLVRMQHRHPLETLEPVVTTEHLQRAIAQVRDIHIEPELRTYIASLARATREHSAIELGVSPRGTLALFRATQAMAALRGRGFATPDDVKAVSEQVLTHRMLLSPDARLRGRTMGQILDEIVDSVSVPVESV
jgi:MoxR-like ATPase